MNIKKHHQQDELNYIDRKARCLVVGSHGNSKHFTKTIIPFDTKSRIRILTIKECMRLQTVDENYLMPISDSQKYKCLGNGWTIDVIAHIFSYLKK